MADVLPQHAGHGGLGGLPSLGGPVLQAPGRVIEVVERKTLPDGREVQVRYLTSTVLAPDGTTYVTLEQLIHPPTTSGITPRSLADLYLCMCCHAIATVDTVIVCGRCGLVACSCCACLVPTSRGEYLLCTRCTSALLDNWVVRLIKTVVGLVKRLFGG